MQIKSNLIDIIGRRIYPAEITVENGIIISIQETNAVHNQYILPGFIDAHVHIESSLLVPSEFARLAVLHGTVATVSDPHEIANVLGLQGVEFMIENGRQVPFHFFFGAPSCVPATIFETAGAALGSKEVDALLKRDEILYLTEMMNYPGVLFEDAEVMAKIVSAKKHNKPVDGHAPGLQGEQAIKYIAAGISTDHECYTLEEALEKLNAGMKILIREGSAARNFDTLIPLMKEHAAHLMFCSDDKHPDSLLLGHINQLVERAVALGYDLFDVLKVACLNPIAHYKLPVGQLKVGDSADFIITKDLKNFIIDQTYINGKLVASEGKSLIEPVKIEPINQFNIGKKTVQDFAYEPKETELVIECLDGQLITNKLSVARSQLLAANDCLKLVVVNRYFEALVAISYVKNFGLNQGAIAGSVAHDSHNIIAVGVSDAEICNAVNLIIENTGGLSAVMGSKQLVLPLPVAGLMSNADAWKVAADYTDLDNFSKHVLGSKLRAPFMSLSFMALLVIPHLKLSDKGLFDGDTFQFV
ncbi:MAG: adenine deaminase [Bacteroidota bacterium]|nr:adenine deaminase [Bacteroidota bacterium]